MNLALPALVVFILLLPGFIARSRFKRAERTLLDFSPFGEAAIEAVLWACVFHVFWTLITSWCFSRFLQPEIVLHLLSSDAAKQSLAIKVVAQNFHEIIGYFLSIFAGAYLLPTVIRRIITQFRLDRNEALFGRWLRFHQAPWYYLLSGSDFSKGDEPDFIAISAIVDVAGKAVLFTGILDEYFVDSEGVLDRLILQDVMRRPIDDDKPHVPTGIDPLRFYAVDGDYFVLRYAPCARLVVGSFVNRQ
jgi:hypothetical protein